MKRIWARDNGPRRAVVQWRNLFASFVSSHDCLTSSVVVCLAEPGMQLPRLRDSEPCGIYILV